MFKSIAIIIVGVLVMSGFNSLALTVENKDTTNVETIIHNIDINTTSIKFMEKDAQYLEVNLDGIQDYLMNPGQPMVPRLKKSYELPFGVYNVKISAKPSGFKYYKIEKEISPAPAPLPLTPREKPLGYPQKDITIYHANEYYPHQWYGYHVGCGLNHDAEHVTHLTVNVFPIRYHPHSGIMKVAESINLEISYELPEKEFFPQNAAQDMVIITPQKFSSHAQRLANHKNTYGVKTFIKTTEDIFSEYTGRDEPEKIKCFIKDAIESEGISYVLLFGGLKSLIYAKPKDDQNHGAKGWYVPVRYSNFQYDGGPGYNFTSGEPNYLTDLYYADIYKEGGVFDDWDSNGNNIFAEWSGDLIRDDLDLYPDIAFGRLAVRNSIEARNVVNKIINYEKQPADPSWFRRMISISGDGFLDQEDWNIQWNTSNLPDGEYTIIAQSRNPNNDIGPTDKIHITLDKTAKTNITFNHDDHLKAEVQAGYPAPPIAEIMTISNGNTLGYDNYSYTPGDGQAYCNTDLYWYANISYIDEVLTIRGKSYDPKPYGNITHIHVWITNETNSTVFSVWRNNTETYYEGEWIVGEKLLRGRGGALVYIPNDFGSNSVFTSNGTWVTQDDVINEFSKGYGLAFFSGHGSPGWWGDHYPGVPGNRRHGSVAGLVVTQLSLRFPFIHFPVYPMHRLKNINKLPVVAVGGCHNSQFNVSLIPSVLDLFLRNSMNTYGTPIHECWGWYMVKLPKTGAIATMGNTGYGWGSEGDVCTIGTGDGWINTEFFRQYGEEHQNNLGLAYIMAITEYIDHHKIMELEYWRHDYGWDGIDQKTVEQWELLGDPSLMIGGYS